MLHSIPFRAANTLPMALLACLTVGSPTSLLAQGGGRGGTQGTVHVFKGGGTDRSTQGRKPPRAPTALNQLDLKKLAGLVGSEPGTVYVKLTPQAPAVTNRGVLVFVRPSIVETGESYATWTPPVGGSVSLWLRPAADKKYLIDCAVGSNAPGAHFTVTGAAGPPMQVEAIQSGQHLTFVFDSPNNTWQYFQITAGGTKSRMGFGTEVDWNFYWCEVTNL